MPELVHEEPEHVDREAGEPRYAIPRRAGGAAGAVRGPAGERANEPVGAAHKSAICADPKFLTEGVPGRPIGGVSRAGRDACRLRCLAIRDRVHETGERVVILKRGRPVAELSRITGDGNDYPQAELEGTVVLLDDVVGPVFSEEHWDSLKR